MIDKDDVNIWEGIGTTIGIGAGLSTMGWDFFRVIDLFLPETLEVKSLWYPLIGLPID